MIESVFESGPFERPVNVHLKTGATGSDLMTVRIRLDQTPEHVMSDLYKNTETDNTQWGVRVHRAAVGVELLSKGVSTTHSSWSPDNEKTCSLQ